MTSFGINRYMNFIEQQNPRIKKKAMRIAPYMHLIFFHITNFIWLAVNQVMHC